MISKENKLRTIIMRRLTVFFKLVIFWAGIGFSENLTLTALKFHFDDKLHEKKLHENDDSVAYDRILEICNLLGRNGVNRQFYGKVSKCGSDGKHRKLS